MNSFLRLQAFSADTPMSCGPAPTVCWNNAEVAWMKGSVFGEDYKDILFSTLEELRRCRCMVRDMLFAKRQWMMEPRFRGITT